MSWLLLHVLVLRLDMTKAALGMRLSISVLSDMLLVKVEPKWVKLSAALSTSFPMLIDGGALKVWQMVLVFSMLIVSPNFLQA